MTEEGYTAFTLHWQDFTITVEYQANWLNSGHWHLQLRCDERLPVTETGYRSIFVPEASFADEDEIRAFVTTYLDEAAQSKAWQAHLEDRRQMKLF